MHNKVKVTRKCVSFLVFLESAQLYNIHNESLIVDLLNESKIKIYKHSCFFEPDVWPLLLCKSIC